MLGKTEKTNPTWKMHIKRYINIKRYAPIVSVWIVAKKNVSNNFHLSRNICSCVLLFAELLGESLQLCYRRNSVEAVALGTFVNFQNIYLRFLFLFLFKIPISVPLHFPRCTNEDAAYLYWGIS